MKRWGIAAAAAVLALSGCAGSPDSITEDQYVEFMSELPSYEGMPRANLVELGQGFCDVADTAHEGGVDHKTAQLEYLKMATDEGLDAKDVGAFFAYAAGAYCPEYLDEGLSEVLED